MRRVGIAFRFSGYLGDIDTDCSTSSWKDHARTSILAEHHKARAEQVEAASRIVLYCSRQPAPQDLNLLDCTNKPQEN